MIPDADIDERDLEAEWQELYQQMQENRNAGLLSLTRQMPDSEEELDCDLGILDWVSYKAFEDVFNWRTQPDHHQSDMSEVHVNMTNDFLTIMWNKTYDDKDQSDAEFQDHPASFRVLLLQFILVFTHRLSDTNTFTTTESLASLRAEENDRFALWIQTHQPPLYRDQLDPIGQFPLPRDQALENRHELSSALSIHPTKRNWTELDIRQTPALKDLLGLFIQLTANRVRRGDWEMGEEWCDLVAQFMVQAVIEEYLCREEYGPEAFNAVFSFGCPKFKPSERDPDWMKDFRLLFCEKGSQSCKEKEVWSTLRQVYYDELRSITNDDCETIHFLERLTCARVRYPISDFETKVLGFLKELHASFKDKPDLIMIEERKITCHGVPLSAEENEKMFESWGLAC
ncbi:hypothetical protein GQ43DRAFT_432037 [Delitschia confertaspora ATCC 74209]|uniref:Uncharacterized protein n=1 Tax=Delitschia confertaspora ATCC 74209 TaxID=1513339 RepID=A0A9P4JQY9_9PLEO|nr:hypothetical protein GQ43DRAFT_432037 [Delitschia confertaspora ATCC 74209]